MTYKVKYQVREHGAIGWWMVLSSLVQADSEKHALEVFRATWAEKYDFGTPVSVAWFDDKDGQRVRCEWRGGVSLLFTVAAEGDVL